MADPIIRQLARAKLPPTLRNPISEFMQSLFSGDGRSANPGWDALSDAEKAAYYSDNPTMAGITQFGQKALGYAPFGIGMAMQAQKAYAPDFVAQQESIARGIDPATGLQVGGYGSRQAPDLQSFDIATPTPTGLYGDQYADMPAPQSMGMFESFLNSILPSSAVSLGPVAAVEDRAPSLTPAGIEAANIAGGYGNNEGYGAGFGGPDTSNSFGEGEYAQGGMVDADDLKGQAPGPDDGYGALQGGEYVIKKAAVDKYGQAMLDAINNGTFQFKQGLANFMATK
jgi:hypothetical protein